MKMTPEVRKIPSGFSVDGIELKSGKCGCTSLAKCCYSWSKVKRRGEEFIEVTAKMTEPDTADTYQWGYTVRKDGFTVSVAVEDARDKEIFSGHIPPPVAVWEERGWEVLDRKGKREDGAVWRCATCKWLYREDAEGVPFEELPEGWTCPRCGAGRNVFERIG
jgi:rubredoxin